MSRALREATRICAAAGVVMALACEDNPSSPSDVVLGSGNVVSESRPVENFDAVALTGIGRLVMEASDRESLTITAEDNILPLLRSEVVGGTLEFGPVPRSRLNPTREILYTLTYREMNTIATSGVTTVLASGIDTSELTVSASGTSTAEISGEADRQRLILSGTSTYRAEELRTRFTRLEVSGTSRAVVNASEILEGVVSGTAVVEYVGTPVVSVTVSGTAVLRPR
jgi:hypothetical protein